MANEQKKIRQFYLRGGIVLFLFFLWYSFENWPIRFHFPVKGKASWYSRHSPGVRERTANNEKFDDTAMTCALWGVRFNQKVKVTNLATGESIVVRVNDRGPHRRFVRQGRVIDLTRSAFRQIEDEKRGLVNVRVELVSDE